jgi:hypothetical protein
MKHYFIAANFWLLVALVLFTGRTFERGEPTRYSVFHYGQWFSPEAYALLIAGVLGIAAVFIFLSWKTRDKK